MQRFAQVVFDLWVEVQVGDKQLYVGFEYDKNARGTYHANLHFNPQVKYDLGKALHWGEKQLYVGFEYDYWKNKYGIEDSGAFKTNQDTASFLVKYHF